MSPAATPRFQKTTAVMSVAGERDRSAAHAGQHPHDQAERGRADPAVDERVDRGGIDAAEGEGAAVVGEPVEETSRIGIWSAGCLREEA